MLSIVTAYTIVYSILHVYFNVIVLMFTENLKDTYFRPYMEMPCNGHN